MGRRGGRAKRLTEAPHPQLDSDRVGVTLVSVVYGVVLVNAFGATLHGYVKSRRWDGASWPWRPPRGPQLDGVLQQPREDPICKVRSANIPLRRPRSRWSRGDVLRTHRDGRAPGWNRPGDQRGPAVCRSEPRSRSGQHEHAVSAYEEARIVAAIFIAYFVWDVLETWILGVRLVVRRVVPLRRRRGNASRTKPLLERGTQKALARAALHLVVTFVFVIFVGRVRLPSRQDPHTSRTVVLIDCGVDCRPLRVPRSRKRSSNDSSKIDACRTRSVFTSRCT